MRKWRLFFIAIISFIAILGENWLKKIIPISLCILLNSNSAACYINFHDGRVEAAISNSNVTDNSSNQILALNQDLPTKQEDDFQHKLPSQIAIPPIIRPAETNLYIQNALPQDFRISSQIPYSSGKQEILLVSPSTGAEQLYTFNVPGSKSFQLFEVEYKKVSAIDFTSLTNTDSLIVNPEQIKSVLNKFKITFANNSLSKITLSDGTTANFSPGQAIIKSPQGQTVETVQISQNEFIDKNIFVSQERGKMNKNIGNNPNNKDANLLAKTSESACQAAVSSSLNGISNNLGQWGNKLTTSKSPTTKSVGWAISFGSGAIKSNISTKNPMLQEVNCRPPVQCEEQRVSGGSEIRTDLFQVVKGANRKVKLDFEFYEIPDRIELYFDGKQIFGVGPKSGQGNQTFNLPANAEYVGVKLIGNDNVNTRWWYVISCSGSQLAEAPDIAKELQEAPDIAKELQEARDIAQELQAEPAWKEGLDPCPCTLGDARELTKTLVRIRPDQKGFDIVRDPIFVESTGDDRKLRLIGKDYHPGASYSFRSHSSRVGYFKLRSGKTIRPGQQCTYDNRGKLITNGPGAGTPDAYAPEVTPDLAIYRSPKEETHTYWDTKPFDAMTNNREDGWENKDGWKEYHRVWTPNRVCGLPKDSFIRKK
jgi:hypothetical protein